MNRRILLAALVVPLMAAAQGQQPQPPDPWEPLRFLAGTWKGGTEGEAGKGTVARSYEFVMRGRFLYERNTSTYPPQEKNPKGEVHEHWTMFSYDRARKTLVMRQFHVEGFVNQYAMPAGSASAKDLVFESEGFENLPAGWKARERYEVISKDEFIETFELAPPGQAFSTYSRTHFRRAK